MAGLWVELEGRRSGLCAEPGRHAVPRSARDEEALLAYVEARQAQTRQCAGGWRTAISRDGPIRVRAADITDLETAVGWCFCAAELDVPSHTVVAGGDARPNRYSLVLAACQMGRTVSQPKGTSQCSHAPESSLHMVNDVLLHDN
jgi:hypothetical protein